MSISVFDLFTIGIGPSSSHTVGPMRAAHMFVSKLDEKGLLETCRRLRVHLYGSLGATGRGHGSDKAVILGLEGAQPESVDVDAIPSRIRAIDDSGSLDLLGKWTVPFMLKEDLQFEKRDSLPGHPNGLRFIALDEAGETLL